MKRFPGFPHYSSKWTTSSEGDFAATSGPHLGNPRLGSTLKCRSRRGSDSGTFGLLLQRVSIRSICSALRSLVLPNAPGPVHPARHPHPRQSLLSKTPTSTHPRGKRAGVRTAGATLSATFQSPGSDLAIPLL